MESHFAKTKSLFASIQCLVLDLDGTLYLGERWIDGAIDFVQAARASGRRVMVLTNNSSHSRAHYRTRLRQKGLPLDKNDILTSGRATMAYLQKNHPQKKCFCWATKSYKKNFYKAEYRFVKKNPKLLSPPTTQP